MSQQQTIYLDYAAATPMEEEVRAVMLPFFIDKFFNPSSDYAPSREVNNQIKQARQDVAKVLGAKTEEICFTAGGTEANNLAILGTASKYGVGEIVSTEIEHDSVLEPIKYLKQSGRKVSFVKPGKDGIIAPQKIIDKINDKTALVSMMYANNEIGSIQPIKQVSDAIKKIKESRQERDVDLPLYFHTDACQAANYLSLQTGNLGIDMMTLNGGKIYGPKQIGILYIKAGTLINPIIYGGGQERGLRSGTENTASIIGLSKALEITNKIKKAETRRLMDLQKHFIKQIQLKMPNAELNGSIKHRLPNNIHLTFPHIDNERLLIELDEKGIFASAGSACSAKKNSASHVLRALGKNDEQAKSSIRLTLGRQTTKQDIDQTIDTLCSLVV